MSSPASPSGPTFWEAAEQGDKKKLVAILERSLEFDINALDNNGRSAMHWAVESKRMPAVRLLIDYGADVRMRESATGRSAVFLAVKANDVEQLEMLVEHLSADEIAEEINGADRFGITPVSLCRERQEEMDAMFRWVMQHGGLYMGDQPTIKADTGTTVAATGA